MPPSVTPNSLTVAWPPARVPSSASMAWKQRLSLLGLKPSGTGGRSHDWSFSEFTCFRSDMSWLIFSRTSLSKALFGWLEASFPRPSFWELASRAAGMRRASSRLFLELEGLVLMLRRLLEASPNMRFWGRTAPGIVSD